MGKKQVGVDFYSLKHLSNGLSCRMGRLAGNVRSLLTRFLRTNQNKQNFRGPTYAKSSFALLRARSVTSCRGSSLLCSFFWSRNTKADPVLAHLIRVLVELQLGIPNRDPADQHSLQQKCLQVYLRTSDSAGADERHMLEYRLALAPQ